MLTLKYRCVLCVGHVGVAASLREHRFYRGYCLRKLYEHPELPLGLEPITRVEKRKKKIPTEPLVIPNRKGRYIHAIKLLLRIVFLATVGAVTLAYTRNTSVNIKASGEWKTEIVVTDTRQSSQDRN